MYYFIIAISIVIPVILIFFFVKRSNGAKPVEVPIEEEVKENDITETKKKPSAKPTKIPKSKPTKPFSPKSDLCIASLKGFTENITCFAWSHDGKLLAAASTDRTIRVFITSTFTTATPKYIRVSTDLDYVRAMDFTEDNRFLVCALGESKQIAIYRLSKDGGSCYKQFPIERNHYPSRICVSGSAERMCILLACCDKDTVLRVYDCNGSLKARVDNAQLENYGSAFNYHRDFFATGSFAPDTKIYSISRVTSSQEYQKFSKIMNLAGPRNSVLDVSFDQHDRVGVVSKDPGLFIWSIDVRYQLQEDPFLLHCIDLGKEYQHIALHPLENVAVVTSGVECAIIDIAEDKRVVIDEVAATSVKDLKASPDGCYFAVLGNNERQVTIWKYSH